MREQKQIIIDIDQDGNCSIDGQGFHGSECSHFISEVENALGERTFQRDKPEYRQRRTVETRNRQLGGR